ncbi:MAG: HD domain-containing protein [Lachnospiraceae bacterium]|nr:HD domain-containing protein [Lachnospiraceae bacterium]
MTLYYFITAALAFINLMILIFTFEAKKTNYYFMILLLLMAMANGGYLSIALATTVQEAVLANKICYLGGCFMPIVTFFLSCDVCNYQMKPWLKRLLYVYSLGVYMMVLTIGYSDLYYTDVYLEKLGDATVLGHTYGIGHKFFYVILYGYLLIQIFLLVFSWRKKKAVSRKNVWALMLTGAVTIISFMIGQMINSNIEVIPVVYVIDGWIFLYMYRRGLMYSIEDNVAESVRTQDTFGYIMFDSELNYLGCNNAAARIFPDISECTIDSQIEHVAELYTLLEWVEEYTTKKKDSFSYETENRHYDCHIDTIWYRKKPRGYILEFREDTDKWRYVNLLAEHNSELEKFQVQLENKVNEQTKELKVQQEQIKKLFTQTITALSEAVDAKDRYTSGHSKRVAEYARKIAERMGKSKEEQEKIYRAGLLHDVGKIRVPAEIINKPGKLTEEEFNIIKIHSVTGYHILRGISDDNFIAIAAKYHHERFDGKGYPNGLAGEKIPEVARILAVADSYDAMASNRSYRMALPQEVVRSEIEKGMGTQFDPVIAEIMLQMIAEDKEYAMKQTDALQKRILTVDDEAMNNKIIAHIMKDEPMYEVISASGGYEALELLSKQSFDLILFDVKMPEINGLETIKLIREKYQTPVILRPTTRICHACESIEVSTEYR